jgi:hypothetical protein
MKRIKISKEQYNLLKENFPKVKGGLNRVNKLFKSTFSEQEEITYNNTIKPVDIKLPKSIQKPNKPIFENQMDYIRVSDDFLKYLYIDEIKKLVKKGELNLDVEKIKYPRDLENKDITFDKLANELEKQGVLVKDVETQRYLVDDSLTKEKAMSEIEDTIRTLIGDNFNKLFSRASKKFVSQFKPKNIYENNDLVIEKLDEGKCSLRYKDTDETYDVNESILNELAKIYEKDKKLMSIIEAEFPELWGKYKKSIEKARTKPETKKTRDELVKAIQDIRKKELEKRELEKDDDTIDEVTSSASVSPSYVGLFNFETQTAPTNTEEIPVVYETNQGTDSVSTYDANALINIGRNGQFKPAKKTKAQKQTQYPDGGFVEFNDCVKLNNKPAGSGCSTGAIDNVVRVKKTKGNIISPSLNESINNEIEFNNWVIPDETTLKREFYVEHKLKGNNFFESEEEFLNAVKNGSIITLTNDDDKRLIYRSRTKTKDSLLGLIRTYGSYPQFRNEETVEAIYDGYKNNSEMELPIVIEFNNGRRRIFSGNTRLDIAFQLGIEPKVLLIKSNVEF